MAHEDDGNVTLAVLKKDIEYMRQEIDELKSLIKNNIGNLEGRVRELELCTERLIPVRSIVYSLLTALVSTAIIYSILFLRK